jgi:hypothetical protein
VEVLLTVVVASRVKVAEQAEVAMVEEVAMMDMDMEPMELLDSVLSAVQKDLCS